MIMNDLGIETTLARMVTWIDAMVLPVFLAARRPDGAWEFIHANAPWRRLHGVTPDPCSGQTITKLLAPRVAMTLEGHLHSCLEAGGPITFEETAPQGGDQTWWETTLSPVNHLTKTAHGRGTGTGAALGPQSLPEIGTGHRKLIIGMGRPVTERKEREVATTQRLAQMQNRFEDLRLFSTIAAHDARSPLATVSSLVDLVRADLADTGSGSEMLLGLISQTVTEALQQIDGTLSRARALEASADIAQEFEFGRICRDIATMVDPARTLDISVPEAQVECDRMIVQMGLRNLISNAARHCRSRINISLGENRAEGRIRIDVTDDGAGLPDGLGLDDVIRRAEASDGTSGFGLGAIAKLVQPRGGSLELLPARRADGLPGAGFRLLVRGRILRNQAPDSAARFLAEPAQA